MIVTSDSIVLMMMSSDTSVGTPPGASKPLSEAEADAGTLTPAVIRPSSTNASTGMTIVPIAPSGSRRKILVSSQVRFQSPRSMVFLVVSGRPVSRGWSGR